MKYGTWIRRLACFLTVAALLVTAGCGKKKEPEPEQTAAQWLKARIGQALAAVDESVEATSAQGGVDMTVSLELNDGSYEEMDINDYLRGSSLGMKVDAREDRVGLEGSIVVMGETFLSGKAIYQDGILGFQVPELDETYYTVDVKELLSQSEEGLEYLMLLERMQNAGQLDTPTAAMESVAERYIDLAAETVTRDNLKTEKADFSFDKVTGGKTYTGKAHVFTPSAQDVEGFLLRLADEVEDDDELREVLMWAAQRNGNLALYGQDTDELRRELDEGLEELADQLRQNAQQAGRETEEGNVHATVYTGKHGAWKAELTAGQDSALYRLCAEGCDTGFALWVEKDEEGEADTPFEVVAHYGQGKAGRDGTVTVAVKSGRDATTVELAFENVSDETSSLGINYGKYTMTLDDLGEIALDVTRADGGTDHVLSWDIPMLSRLCSWQGAPDLGGAKLTFHTTDRAVTVSAPDGPVRALDVANMDSGEIEAVFAPWEGRMKSLTRDLLIRMGLD